MLGLAAAYAIADYATRRYLSSWARTPFRSLFRALLGLIVFGIVVIFASIPHENIIYAVAGLVIFGVFTIFDFNRLRRSTPTQRCPSRPGSSTTSLTSFCWPWICFGGQRGTELCQPTTPKESPR